MTAALFTLAFAVAVAALGWRRFVRARASRDLARELCAREERVDLVSDYGAVDAALEKTRCGACDGRTRVVSEAPRDGVIVVELACVRCGQRFTRRFRVPEA